MNQADVILERLDGWSQRANDSWMAKCPAHDDRTPSLSIRLLDDGRVWVNCFAGCDTPDVVEAVGLTMRDLFPGNKPRDRKVVAACRREIIGEILLEEKRYVAIYDAHVKAGEPATEEEKRNYILAKERIRKIEGAWSNE